MNALRGRTVGEAGSLMPLHAAGLHGLQAVPLVALLAAATAWTVRTRLRVTCAAGIGWLVLCLGLLRACARG